MDFWHTKLHLGSLSIPRFIGGPVDGVTDPPFRKIVRWFSKEALLFTEMRHAAQVAHPSCGFKTLRFCQSERPLIFQFSANTVEPIEEACRRVLEVGVDAVDLNIGCPSRNVTGSGSGSALMADPERLAAILKKFRSSLPIPLTVKMRAGFTEKNATEIAQLVQDCGVDAIFLHPRLKNQKHQGEIDYELARRVKDIISIPLIISGGIVDWPSAKYTYEQTGCDGFLVSRGLIAQPWKLRELREASQGKEPTPIDGRTKARCALAHLDHSRAHYGFDGLLKFRKHIPYYLKGIEGATNARSYLMTVRSPEALAKKLQLVLEG